MFKLEGVVLSLLSLHFKNKGLFIFILSYDFCTF